MTIDLCRRLCTCAGVLLAAVLAGCGTQSYTPAPVDAEGAFTAYSARGLDDPGLREFLHAQGRSVEPWPRERWDLESLTFAALYFNPGMKVAQARWELQKAGEISAAQRINPALDLPVEWHTNMDGGDESPWLIGMVLDLVLELRGKRAARIERAALESAAARIDIERTAWDIRGRLHHALAEYVAAREAGAALERRRGILEDIAAVLDRRREAGQVGAFEVSATRLELQRIRLEFSEQQRLLEEARVQLATAIGVPPVELSALELSALEAQALPGESDLPAVDIRGLALQNRHDVRRALTEYAAQEAALKLEIAQQYPDINLSPGFIFDQGDNVWALGSAWVLPLFHRREGQIAEALRRRALLGEQFMALQAAIVNDVRLARSSYLGRLRTYEEARSLAAGAAAYEAQIEEQLRAGYADRLQYLRARQARAEAEQAVVAGRTALLRAFAALEQALQYPLQGGNWPDVAARLVAAEADDDTGETDP